MEDTVDVELDVFSGRTNPRWKLTEKEATELASRLHELPEAGKAASFGLGYRGFVVHNPAREFGIPSLLRIWQGISDLSRPKNPVHYADVHGAEALLTELAKAHGYAVNLGR
jgi:hypothetical protein